MPARASLGGLAVLVTGASSGLGRALAEALAGAGGRVVGTGRDSEGLRQAQGLSATIAADLCSLEAAGRVVEEAVGHLGRLDVLVSCAGRGWLGPFTEMSCADLDSVLDINLRVPMHLARAAGDHLVASPRGGQLVLIGSIAGLVGVGQEVAYGAAKAGLKGLADGLREEWSSRDGHGVSITLISPGPVATPFFANRGQPYMRRWPRPAPVDRVVARTVRAIQRRQADVVVPTWLSLPARLNGGAPNLYHALSQLRSPSSPARKDRR